MRFATLAVHAAHDIDPTTGAIAPPLHLSTTYARDAELRLVGEHQYIREGNPTQSQLERALAPLESGEAALVLSSGMAAAAAVLQSLEPGAHVVLPDDAYYHMRAIAHDFLPRWGMRASIVDMADLGALRAALTPQTRLVWLESPSNPLLKVVDLVGAIAAARAAGALTAVDNTFATPALQRPLELGADVVLHSTTKYLGGHSDVQGGALVFRRRDGLTERVAEVRQVLGGVSSPFNSWLVLRGIRTLACRVEAQSRSALAVARALESHPAIAAVHYPGLEGHPNHEVARRQMSAFGAMMSLRIQDGEAAAKRAVGRLRLFTRATSLGGVESLVEHRRTSEGAHGTAPPELIRLSIGLEHPDDLIADLEQALSV
ncbi:MAG TPA: PLP-dependent transferase [Thermoanaerobaculia bacterium]|nr:PLP-dependent transferase [Thermoanaerobaculia bacterium]